MVVMSQKIIRMENDFVKKDRLIAEERRKNQKTQRENEALRKQLIKLGADPDSIEYSDLPKDFFIRVFDFSSKYHLL